MNTPICDFVNEYCRKESIRLHMPGHKGKSVLGPEALDLTEISGADVLYENGSISDRPGIIAESEANAAAIFGSAKTLYSTEGSSLCIRAMLYLVKMFALDHRSAEAESGKTKAEKGNAGRKIRIAAGRNAHKTFITAAALLDLDVEWLYSEKPGLTVCELSPEQIESCIIKTQPDAVFITSPDYLGNIADIAGIAAVCHRHGCVLLVDNAHGAYLKFMPGEDGRSLHPLDRGADLCCDSAHKTLPVLTGGAYLHISESVPDLFRAQTEHAMKMFASTSPSYLIMQSLDKVNALIAKGLDREFRETAGRTAILKEKLCSAGYALAGTEPLKITLDACAFGYRGDELDAILEEQGIYCEFYDPEYLVLMVSPFNTERDLAGIEDLLANLDRRETVPKRAPKAEPGKREISLHEAMLCPGEEVPIGEAEGRILASADVACPPAIPIAVCGERISRPAIDCFRYYGIDTVNVIKEK